VPLFSHRHIDIRRLSASQSQDQPEELALRSRARIGALLAGLGVLHVVGLALNIVGPTIWSWHQACASVGILVHVVGLVMTGVCLRLTHRPDWSVKRLVDMVLVYEVLTSLGIAFAEEAQTTHGISLVAMLIVLFPLFVPTSPRRTVVASMLAAAMPVLAHVGAASLRGGDQLGGMDYAPYAFNFLAAGFAVVPAKIMAAMADDVRAARRLKHCLLRRPAAIKLIKEEALCSEPGVRGRLIERFEREAQATAALQSPHTVALYDFGVASDGTFYHVMELLNGLDLETLVRKFGPVPAERAVAILLQACDALEDAHRAGLVHRDIKPANIFLARLGRRTDFVKVLDFGLVKDRRPKGADGSVLTTQANEMTGTPSYMAPEQVVGADPVDGRADIYALGCVAYWLVTGNLVFDESSAMAMVVAHTTKEPTPPSERTELDVPPALDALILSCLAKSPDDRPQSADELARALEALDVGEWSPEQAREWWGAHLPEHAEPAAAAPSAALPSALAAAS